MENLGWRTTSTSVGCSFWREVGSSQWRAWGECTLRLNPLIDGGKGTRTSDPLLAKQMLPHLSYAPTSGTKSIPCRENVALADGGLPLASTISLRKQPTASR